MWYCYINNSTTNYQKFNTTLLHRINVTGIWNRIVIINLCRMVTKHNSAVNTYNHLLQSVALVSTHVSRNAVYQVQSVYRENTTDIITKSHYNENYTKNK